MVISPDYAIICFLQSRGSQCRCYLKPAALSEARTLRRSKAGRITADRVHRNTPLYLPENPDLGSTVAPSLPIFPSDDAPETLDHVLRDFDICPLLATVRLITFQKVNYSPCLYITPQNFRLTLNQKETNLESSRILNTFDK